MTTEEEFFKKAAGNQPPRVEPSQSRTILGVLALVILIVIIGYAFYNRAQHRADFDKTMQDSERSYQEIKSRTER